ncbi:hypothetical protein key_174 [Erwinia phage KEY]|uniref:Uncharacterized protein n=1 Tax=Erwinia phage KEY TaxID=2821255 RepID=A0AAE7WCM9_9CAUD|nr:hypothetical protein key_174 [Erwinia phage KEY]
MFNYFPSLYVIVALYTLAGYFYSRFEFWLKQSFDSVGYSKQERIAHRYSRRNAVLFSVFLVLALILSTIDFLNSAYIGE